jgi:prepilin-type N-terminal cleavage/methylation domain-containing protein
MKPKHNGFTIVELLIVIVVIGILAAITIVSYNGVQTRAANARTSSDMRSFEVAVKAMRELTGKTLYELYTAASVDPNQPCGSWNGSDPVPKSYPKTHACWTHYYQQLSVLEQSADMKLTGLRDGDSNGNPYFIDATEGRNPGDYCLPDRIWQYTGTGSLITQIKAIDLSARIQVSCP